MQFLSDCPIWLKVKESIMSSMTDLHMHVLKPLPRPRLVANAHTQAYTYITPKTCTRWNPGSVSQEGSNENFRNQTQLRLSLRYLGVGNQSICKSPDACTHSERKRTLRKKVSFIFKLFLTDKPYNKKETDVDCSVKSQSHQAKLVQLTPLPAISGCASVLHSSCSLSASSIF